ncbi:TB2_DP1_HVA22 domain-containing protein [Cephalotus follicularis]|uniref:HVA22-like protein n=1 Tax=Cephalotus follicularis TaxID=3775 RepID=A0A1Q3BII3_CEPFO|nr:TB2_DP1_HVA22 domain-containing protein [Cephalotus follicularis]
MIGSFLTRGLVMVFGYAYPAYECYKTVEKNKPEIEQLRFWCQYWILVAVLTVSERVGDAFISWLPMYSEAKLAFFIYLWYPKTKGTTYVYDSFFKPYVAKHENEIDRNLLELRTRAGDMAVLYWQRAASYGQTRIFEILQYISAQSTPRPRPTQQQGSRARQPAATSSRQAGPAAASSRQAAPATQPEVEEPPSPTSSTSSSQLLKELAEEVVAQVPKVAAPAAASDAQNANAASESTSQSTPTETEEMQIEALPSSSVNESMNPPPKETVMEEAIRVTRGRLRKNRAVVSR